MRLLKVKRISALRLGAGLRDEAGEGDRVPAVPSLLRDGALHEVRAAVQPDLVSKTNCNSKLFYSGESNFNVKGLVPVMF